MNSLTNYETNRKGERITLASSGFALSTPAHITVLRGKEMPKPNFLCWALGRGGCWSGSLRLYLQVERTQPTGQCGSLPRAICRVCTWFPLDLTSCILPFADFTFPPFTEIDGSHKSDCMPHSWSPLGVIKPTEWPWEPPPHTLWLILSCDPSSLTAHCRQPPHTYPPTGEPAAPLVSTHIYL